jgi:hypothetical protein
MKSCTAAQEVTQRYRVAVLGRRDPDARGGVDVLGTLRLQAELVTVVISELYPMDRSIPPERGECKSRWRYDRAGATGSVALSLTTYVGRVRLAAARSPLGGGRRLGCVGGGKRCRAAAEDTVRVSEEAIHAEPGVHNCGK